MVHFLCRFALLCGKLMLFCNHHPSPIIMIMITRYHHIKPVNHTHTPPPKILLYYLGTYTLTNIPFLFFPYRLYVPETKG